MITTPIKLYNPPILSLLSPSTVFLLFLQYFKKEKEMRNIVGLLPFVLALVFATVALGTTDPELKQCKHQCQVQQQFGESEKRECTQQCERYHQEKQRRERERGRGGGDEEISLDNPRRDPEKQYRECLSECQGKPSQSRCFERCEEQRREQQRERGGGGGRDGQIMDVENPREPQEKFRECLQRCEKRQEGGSRQERCRQDCEVQRRQAEQRREHEHERGGGRGREEQRKEEERRREHERGSGRGHDDNPRDPEAKYEECLERCGITRASREHCESICEKQRHEREGRGRGSRDVDKYGRQREREEGGEQEEGFGHPYVFEEEHFTTIFRSQHGRKRTLPRFTQRSRLLKGIDNYRVVILEAEPQTFVLPKHLDADTVFFVAQGRGTLSMVRPQKRESFNIRRGDIVVEPAGTTCYVINRSNNERLVVVQLLRPVNTPGQFEGFFGAGGEEPESFYRAFSSEILEAAFNTRRDRFERIFKQQRQGAIIKASEEQIRGMSQHEEGGIWPFGGEHKGTINIFEQRPAQSNQYGQLFEVDGSDFRHLQDLNVAVAVTNITEGSMSTILYNSRATKIAIVVNGEGQFEMACPHLSQESHGGRQGSQRGRQEQGGGSESEVRGRTSYQKVTARLRRGVVVVIPAGHPHVVVASQNQNLEMVSFEVNWNNNERFPLAGKTNVMNQLERQAKELAFGVPAREVDEVFRSQEEDFFFRGPGRMQRRGEHEGRADE